MGVLNVGVDFGSAAAAADQARNPAPAGVYDLRVAEILLTDDHGQPLTTKKGKPQFIAVLEIFNSSNAALNGKKIKHWVMIPTNGDLSAVGFLVDFTKAIGKPWSGSSINTDEFLNQVCRANVSINKPDPSKSGFNNIESFI